MHAKKVCRTPPADRAYQLSYCRVNICFLYNFDVDLDLARIQAEAFGHTPTPFCWKLLFLLPLVFCKSVLFVLFQFAVEVEVLSSTLEVGTFQYNACCDMGW